MPAAAEAPQGSARPGRDQGFLSRHWELDDADQRGAFRFRPHNDNCLALASMNSAPSGAPFRPASPLSTRSPVGIDHTEPMFQLGFKTRLLERAAGSRADLRFGYTQQSYWQAYNAQASRPFRETNWAAAISPPPGAMEAMNGRSPRAAISPPGTACCSRAGHFRWLPG